jgi:hypothetical protein
MHQERLGNTIQEKQVSQLMPQVLPAATLGTVRSRRARPGDAALGARTSGLTNREGGVRGTTGEQNRAKPVPLSNPPSPLGRTGLRAGSVSEEARGDWVTDREKSCREEKELRETEQKRDRTESSPLGRNFILVNAKNKPVEKQRRR